MHFVVSSKTGGHRPPLQFTICNFGFQDLRCRNRMLNKRKFLNDFVGFIVGLGGGLVGLGGAELRLPYLVGSLKLPIKTAIPINLTVSLLTILAALPARLYALNTTALKPFIYETSALGFGAALGSYGG